MPSPTPARLAAVVLIAVTMLTGCGRDGQVPIFAGPSAPPASHAVPESPAPTDSAEPISPTPSALPSKPARKSLNWYLDRVPEFPPAPEPETVPMPEGSSAAFWFRVPTKHKVAFITIDDGALYRHPDVAEFIRRAGIPVTLFLNSPAAISNQPYFAEIQQAGGMIENHTITHNSLQGKPYDYQKREICGCSDKLEKLYGRRPTLFRPPFGNRDAVTMRAARDCGISVVFYWTQTVDKGIVRYQTAEKIVKPGDVLLMHFRPALMDDLLAALKAIHRSGLTPALLEDYIPDRA